ncbi:putative spindle and kinetochore-associated protein 2-like [Scophthalmus maximus]|uniref:Protein FAM33A n=1 Tax=Scophthalmus maximus TaxID=52904 RepID=A0A2U9B9V6_SCOMX|nr:putative spindle and kinetochore-associated protein 2-like [Scophthalmus maximus]
MPPSVIRHPEGQLEVGVACRVHKTAGHLFTDHCQVRVLQSACSTPHGWPIRDVGLKPVQHGVHSGEAGGYASVIRKHCKLLSAIQQARVAQPRSSSSCELPPNSAATDELWAPRRARSFMKSEADLEYIGKRLKLDFINSTAENGCPTEENPAVMLENLRALKAKHTMLCSQLKEITAAQKESMESIRNNLGSVMKLIQHVQQTTDMEVEPLTGLEQESAELLSSAISKNSTEYRLANSSYRGFKYEELSEAMLEAVSFSIHSNIKPAELNTFYQQLQQHRSERTSSTWKICRLERTD